MLQLSAFYSQFLLNLVAERLITKNAHRTTAADHQRPGVNRKVE